MTKAQKLLSIVMLLLIGSVFTSNVHASQLQTFSLSLGDSRPTVSTTHEFLFDHPSNATIREFSFEYCQLASGTCETPISLNTSAATKGTPGDFTGITPAEWSMNAGTAGKPRLQHVGSGDNLPADTTVTIPISTITNSTINGTSDCEEDADTSSDTCYVRVNSYTDLGVTLVDEGIVSYTVVAAITVSARVDPLFKFVIESVGINQVNNEITTNVASTFNTLPFSNITANTPSYAAHSLRVTTNADSGYTITQEMVTQMVGVTAANNVDPFISAWGTPTTWTEPTGSTPNVDTGWIGANTTDTDVSGWSASPEQKFGPVNTTPNTVMQASALRRWLNASLCHLRNRS